MIPRMTALLEKLTVLGRDIKLSHSVFALPFALLATFWAAGGWPHWGQLLLIVACMFFARTYAMLANRYFDRDIDADNPRTAGRALPAGRVSPRTVFVAMAACALLLAAGAAGFGLWFENWWPLVFAPLVIAWLGAYGLMKRYTLLCHFFLGAALAMSPLAAGLAIAPGKIGEPMLWLLAGFVLLWVSGFDVIYALQDVDVDRAAGLRSIPAKLGRRGALWVAKAAHLVGLALLVAIYRLDPVMQQYFLIGLLIVAFLIVAEHRAADRGRFTMAFFTLNGFIALLLGGLGIADVFITKA